eukprot:GHVN01009321.1.p1 GENE.GHVN01009321.1~~GHVN01009321.1.p1  ORF type:complete len:551 (-),score=43.81 GHVN01009321.1:978-2630(-)
MEAAAVVWALELFRPYLYGRRFTVITDHATLQWMTSAKRGKLARWAASLSEFDFTVQPKPGTYMRHADALSRSPVGPPCEDIVAASDRSILLTSPSPNQMPSISEIKAAQEIELGDEKKELIEFDGAFYHALRGTDPPVLRLVVPPSLRRKVMEFMHSSGTAIHPTKARTIRAVTDRFYWKGVAKDVDWFYSSCEACARGSRRFPTHHGLLHPIPTSGPFEILALDIFGPIPTSRRGFKYILVFIDHYSKWVELVGAREVTSKVIANALHEHIITRFTCPSVFLTDRGPQFTSEVCAQLCKMYGVKKLFTSAYHPQGDPCAEAFNKFLKQLLRVVVNTYPGSWDEYLQTIAMTHRTSIHTSIGESPFYALFGRDPVLPCDIELQAPATNKLPINIRERMAVFRKIREAINSHQRREQQISAEKWAKSHRDVDFEVNDLVMHRTLPHQIKGKLDWKWSPPQRVTEKFDNGVTFKLKCTLTGRISTWHCSNLIPFKGEPRPEEEIADVPLPVPPDGVTLSGAPQDESDDDVEVVIEDDRVSQDCLSDESGDE